MQIVVLQQYLWQGRYFIMKTMKRILLLMTCTFVLLGTAACSSRDNADNGADQSTDNRNDQNNTDDTNGTDNVNGTDNANDSNVNGATDGDGIIDNAVDDVTDGVDHVTDDVTDGVDRMTDDLTDNNGAQEDMQNNR